jgi:polysaccharide deacetylase family protein (PEP-CTERM system associated)
VFTVDLEDWPVAVLGPEYEISDRVVANTRRVLQLLQWHGVRATFFVLTRVAERFPALIHEVLDAGHEIASHGHSHKLVTRMTPDEFAADVGRSLDILERLTGERPIGYRAAAWSIVAGTRWAGPILARMGIKYSSSIFPISHRRYGIANAPTMLQRWPDCDLIECPPATVRMFGRNFPVAGGGYFRLLPGAVARTAIRRLERIGNPAVLYMHPYELDAGGVRAHMRAGVPVGFVRRITQEMFRGRFEARLHKLFDAFEFVTMRELLADRGFVF